MTETATLEKPIRTIGGDPKHPVVKRLNPIDMQAVPGYLVSSRYKHDHEEIWENLLELLTDQLREGRYGAYEMTLQSFKIGLQNYAFQDYANKGPTYRKMSDIFRIAAEEAGVHVLSCKTFSNDRRVLIVKKGEGPLIQASGARPGTNAGPDGHPDFVDIPTMLRRAENQEYGPDIDASEIMSHFTDCAYGIVRQPHAPDWVQGTVAKHMVVAIPNMNGQS